MTADKKKIGLFDYINDLGYDKNYLYSEENASSFDTFMVNRAFSQNPDTIMYANEMNKGSLNDKEMVHDFYYYSIPAKKRYGKWAKTSEFDKDTMNVVIEHYQVSRVKALEIMEVLNKEQLNDLVKKYDKRGRL